MRVLDPVCASGYRHQHRSSTLKERQMAWKTPKIIEVPLGAEINSYASAQS
jgi:coenzyme PQQ precursor peptide PqqA